MKTKISEYLDYSEEEKKELWNNATFVFDANILLNLYRYSKETSSTLLAAIKKQDKKRLWLPYQVAYEFMKNRNQVIYGVSNNRENIRTRIDESCNKIKEHLLREDDITSLKNTMRKWHSEYDKANPIQSLYTNEDRILAEILKIFEARTGEKCEDSELQERKEKGKQRFENKTPPGYLDFEKGSNEYGDFLLWQEMLNYAKENLVDIILVTNDQKEDWWKQHGNTFIPRVELRKEFSDTTEGRRLHMYTMNSFLAEYKKQTKETVSPTVLSEVKNLKSLRDCLPLEKLMDLDIQKERIAELTNLQELKLSELMHKEMLVDLREKIIKRYGMPSGLLAKESFDLLKKDYLRQLKPLDSDDNAEKSEDGAP